MNVKKRMPLFLFLSPLLLVIYFFVHEINNNIGLVPPGYALQQALIYLLITLFASMLLWFIFRDMTKVFLFTTLLIANLLFFGAVHDFIKAMPLPAFFSSYTFILILLPVIAMVILVYLKRSKKNFNHAARYMQVVLLILCSWETGRLFWYNAKDKAAGNVLFSATDRRIRAATVTDPHLPNIYFIVFDAFTSSACLKEEFGYNNDSLDSFLQQHGFYVVQNAKSNYPVTTYSIASTLNFSYLVPTVNNEEYLAKDRVKGKITVAHNRLIPYLQNKGYTIYNYSGFDLPGVPPGGRPLFENTEKDLLTQQTLWGRVNRDLMWNLRMRNFKTGKIDYKKIFIGNRTKVLEHNVTGYLKRLTAVTTSGAASPRFVYCHMLMPHEPYYYNRDGSFAQKPNGRSIKQQYLEQLIYANRLVQEVVLTIEKDKADKIIIIEGDHGFRDFGEPGKQAHYFDNLNAIYFYDHNYDALHPSFSPVNTFRVILNQYFDQRLPYLKDTSIYVHDANFFTAAGTAGR